MENGFVYECRYHYPDGQLACVLKLMAGTMEYDDVSVEKVNDVIGLHDVSRPDSVWSLSPICSIKRNTDIFDEVCAFGMRISS